MALDIATLPTESLHKFLSITGLAIVIASFLGFVVTANELTLDAIKLKGESKALEIKATYSDKYRDAAFDQIEASQSRDKKIIKFYSLNGGVKQAVKNKSSEHQMHVDIDTVSKNSVRTRKLLRSFDEQDKEMKLLVLQLTSKQELLEFRYKQLVFLSIGASIAIAAGVRLCFIGFKRWIVVQGYIDAKLLKEAEA